MKIAFFDSHPFEQDAFTQVFAEHPHQLHFLSARLDSDSAASAEGFEAVCSFVNDRLDRACLERLRQLGVRLILLRSAGYNHIDLDAAKRLGLSICNVPEYSPYAVAEHAVALLLTLNRKTHRAFNRVRELNFSLDGLLGFDLHGKTIGIVGTGRIGSVFAHIMHGFGCRILANDLQPDTELEKTLNLHYVELSQLLCESDVISLHLPLTQQSRHLINQQAIAQMKSNVMLINTGRGALIDSKALIKALKLKQIGSAALDVYEEESGVFFEDHSTSGIDDDLLARLTTFPNVLITSHQGFFTREALSNIAQTTLDNVDEFVAGKKLTNAL